MKTYYGPDKKGKLVRDNIPNHLESRNIAFEVREAMSSELTRFIQEKLVEELMELDGEEFMSEAWVGELADVRDVITLLEGRASRLGFYLPIGDFRSKLGVDPTELLEPRLVLLAKDLSQTMVSSDAWAECITRLAAVSLELSGRVRSFDFPEILNRKRKKSGGFSKNLILLWTEG